MNNMIEHEPTSQRIEAMIDGIVRGRPVLKEMTDKLILEYLSPALEWNPSEDTYPERERLEIVIADEVKRLYGKDAGDKARGQLKKSWAVETGAHLHIPKAHDKASRRTSGPQLNPLVSQGQIIWAMANRELGHPLNISLNSGRVPIDNINSGAYIELPSLETPLTTTRKKRYSESPQTFIPATNQKEIDLKIQQLKTLWEQGKIPIEEFRLAQELLDNLNRHQTNFSDQVATSHALVFKRILPPDLQQITLDSEVVATNYLIELLKDPHSLIGKIFTDSLLREYFIKNMAGIETGWKNGESPFYAVVEKNGSSRFAPYRGEVTPDVLLEQLEAKKIWPTGAMKFFTLMTEGGICPIGGMNQSGYCTEIRDRAALLLETMNGGNRANSIRKMPTHIAVVSPCWGIKSSQDGATLLDGINLALNPPTVAQLQRITGLTGKQSLTIAGPSLYSFVTGKDSPIGYSELYPSIQQYAITK